MAANASLALSTTTEPLSFKVLKIMLYSIILLLCLVGNSLVVFIVCKTKRLILPSNLLILNLAMCDLITPITSIPFDLAMEENNYKWPFGNVLCKTLWPLATFSATSSSLTLALISFDRYRVIMHPFKQRLTSKQLKISMIILHTLSAILVAPYIYNLNLVEETQTCQENWHDFSYRQAYTLVLFAVQYGLSLAFMIVMYTITLTNLRLSSGKFENTLGRPRATTVTGMHFKTEDNYEEQTAGRSVQMTRIRCGGIHGRHQNIRATKMFVTVVIVFAICMLPNQIFWLWTDFSEGLESEHSNMAGIICRMFTYMNSVFNPVIYSVFSKDFKKGFRRIYRSLKDIKPRGLCRSPCVYLNEQVGRNRSNTANSWSDSGFFNFNQGRYRSRTTTVSSYKESRDNNNTQPSNSEILNSERQENSIRWDICASASLEENGRPASPIELSEVNHNQESTKYFDVELPSEKKNINTAEELDDVFGESLCDDHSGSTNMIPFTRDPTHMWIANGFETVPLGTFQKGGNRSICNTSFRARIEWSDDTPSSTLNKIGHFLPSSKKGGNLDNVDNDRQIATGDMSDKEASSLQKDDKEGREIFHSEKVKETDI